jgi:hypothetical protein
MATAPRKRIFQRRAADWDFGFKIFTPPLYAKFTGKRESKKLRAASKKEISKSAGWSA